MTIMSEDGKLVAIVAPGCPGCEMLKKYAKEKNLKIEFLDVTEDDRAASIAFKLNIMAVPTLVLMKEMPDGIKLCRLSDDMKIETCKIVKKEELG